MAVLVPCKAEDDGAFCPIERSYADPLSGIPAGWKNAVCEGYTAREIYVGRVLGTGERNGYDDSDFTATVWDDEKGDVAVFVYATTRYPTYHLYAHIDATAEVLETYRTTQAYKVRHMMVMARRDASKDRYALARTLDVPPAAVKRLLTCPIHPHQRGAIIKLVSSFKAGKLRSNFKTSLAQAVMDWLNTPEPKFPTPLSKTQLGYV